MPMHRQYWRGDRPSAADFNRALDAADRLDEAIPFAPNQVLGDDGPPPVQIEAVQISSTTKTAGRYPGFWYSYDNSTRVWTQQTDCWIDPLNGETLSAGTKYLARYIESIPAPTGTLTLNGSPTGGTFTLTADGETTGALNYDESAAHVQAAIRLLTGQSTATATGSNGGPWTVVWGTPPGVVTTDSTGLTGGTSPEAVWGFGTSAVFQTDRAVTSGGSITASDTNLNSFTGITNVRVSDSYVTNPSTGLGLFTINQAGYNATGLVNTSQQYMGAGNKIFPNTIIVAAFGNFEADDTYARLTPYLLRFNNNTSTSYVTFENYNLNSAVITARLGGDIASAVLENRSGSSPEEVRFILESSGLASDPRYCIYNQSWGGLRSGEYSDGSTTGGLVFDGGIYTGGTFGGSITITFGTTPTSGGTANGVTYSDGSLMQSADGLLIDSGGNPVIDLGGGNFLAFGALEAA